MNNDEQDYIHHHNLCYQQQEHDHEWLRIEQTVT